MPRAVLPLLAQAATNRTNEQLHLILQGWMGIAMIAAVGALGLAMIAVLLAVWRRTLTRQRRLEEQIHELRHSVTAIGDAWAASAKRIPGPAPFGSEPDDDEDVDDEDDEEDDPYNLFGGRDPLDHGRDDEEDDDDEEELDIDDDESPPPGF